MAILRTATPLVAAAVAASMALPAAAAKQVEADVIRVEDWDYTVLYQEGFSAEDFLDADVAGKNGKHIGEVEDMVVSGKGRVTHLIVETGGFLDIGDRHLMVPLSEATITGMDSVVIDLQAEQVEDYSLFADVDGQENLPGRQWRISELLDDYAYLRDETRYGWVDDVVITREGAIKAVVVNPDVSYGAAGPYAVPYYGYGHAERFDPGREYYYTPYSAEDMRKLERFDERRLSGEFEPVVVQ